MESMIHYILHPTHYSSVKEFSKEINLNFLQVETLFLHIVEQRLWKLLYPPCILYRGRRKGIFVQK